MFLAPEILHTMGVQGFITYYLFVIALAMGCLIFCLLCIHTRMIGRGETSVESLINENYIEKYRHKGLILLEHDKTSLIRNWKRFLGVENCSDFIRRILLPSTHKPKGNGVTIDDYDVCLDPQYSPSKNKSNSTFVYRQVHENHSTHKHSWKRQLSADTLTSYLKQGKSVTDWKRISCVNEI